MVVFDELRQIESYSTDDVASTNCFHRIGLVVIIDVTQTFPPIYICYLVIHACKVASVTWGILAMLLLRN